METFVNSTDGFNASFTNNSNSSTAGNNTNNRPYNKLFAVPAFLTVYAIFLSFAIVGNCLVCWIVLVNHKMHDITNYLLVNLAVSDLLLAFSSIFQVADFVVKDLNLGDLGCKFQINMNNIPYGSSVLTLTIIAYERYCVVCKPINFPEVKDRLKWIIPSVWLISCSIYFPTIYYCGSRHDEDNQLSCDCTYKWPSLRSKNIYGIFLVVMLYFVPLIAVTGFYSPVIHKLRKRIPGEGEGTNSAYQARQGLVKMLLVTIVVFFVLWTPYNVLYLLKRLEVDYRSVYKFVWYPSLLLGFLNCAYNPIVYCLLSKNFREGFKSVLCCSRYCYFPRIMRAFSSRTLTSRSTRPTNSAEVPENQ